MTEFNFYTAKEIYREKYYQMPKVFFTNNKYKQLSNDSKVAYMLLKERFDYSVQNEWVDQNNHVYFIFTVTELMDLLNCREGKVNKIKKELEAVNLLHQEKNWIKKCDGTLSASPNRLYLGKPELNADDVFKIRENHINEDSTTNAKIAIVAKPCNNSISSTNVKIAIVDETLINEDSTTNAKIANNLFNSSLDTYKQDTKKTDTDKAQQLDQELLATFHLTNTQTFLTEKSLKFIALFSNTFDQAYNTVGIIQRAKKKVEKETGIVLIGEEWQEEIELHLRRVVQKIRTDHTIKYADNYMFKSFCYLFQECSHQLNQNKETTPDISVTLHNFLD